MRILAVVTIIIGSVFTFVGIGDVWLAFQARDAVARDSTASAMSAQDVFALWLGAGAFYLSLGAVLIVISLAVWRRFPWAPKTWLAATTALAVTMAVTHYRFHLGSIFELLVIASLAAVGWFLLLRPAEA